MPGMHPLASVVAGSVAGGLSRYLMSGLTHRITGTDFPYGTLAVNLSGCLAAGLIDGFAGQKWTLSADQRLLLLTGFCGAFTTLSTLVLETSHLAQRGDLIKAAVNVTLTVVLGFALFRIGSYISST